MSDQPVPGSSPLAARPPHPVSVPPELATTAEFKAAPRTTETPPAPSRVLVQGALHEAHRIGRYAVLRQLGEGGMGVVLAAYDEELDRKVALKLLRDRSERATEHRIRILREAQAMARVSHPNVVQVYEVGEFAQPGTPDSHIFIAMEYIDGETLHAWQERPGRSWEEILRMYLLAGQGLLAAHQSGLVHRDFKPDNVLVGADGRPRVADFGLARGGEGAAVDAASLPQAAAASEQSGLLVSPLTQAGAIMGTPMYMSPEQYRGRQAGPRSDQFSFCVALYEALYKTLPFEGATFETLGANVLGGKLRPRPPGSPVPRQLHAALVRGLAADPELRFPSMKELLAALAFDPEQDPAASPLSRRVFSASLVVMSVVLVSLFIGPTLRRQNTVEMALASSVLLFVGVLLATLLLRKTLLRNAFHRGIVLLILGLTGQEALICVIAHLMGMTVAQTIAVELAALAALSVPMTYFFFRRGWLIVPVVMVALLGVVKSPQDSGLIAMLTHVLAAVAAIWLWGRSAGAPELRQLDRRSQPPI